MNWLVKWGVKKYALSIVNKAFADYNEGINNGRSVIAKYIAKVQSLIDFLNSVDKKLADGKITEDEANEICKEASDLGKALAS